MHSILLDSYKKRHSCDFTSGKGTKNLLWISYHFSDFSSPCSKLTIAVYLMELKENSLIDPWVINITSFTTDIMVVEYHEIMNGELVRICKERPSQLSSYYPGICLYRKRRGQDNCQPSRNSKTATVQYIPLHCLRQHNASLMRAKYIFRIWKLEYKTLYINIFIKFWHFPVTDNIVFDFSSGRKRNQISLAKSSEFDTSDTVLHKTAKKR